MKLKIKLVLMVAVIALFASVATVFAASPTVNVEEGPWDFKALEFPGP